MNNTQLSDYGLLNDSIERYHHFYFAEYSVLSYISLVILNLEQSPMFISTILDFWTRTVVLWIVHMPHIF